MNKKFFFIECNAYSFCFFHNDALNNRIDEVKNRFSTSSNHWKRSKNYIDKMTGYLLLHTIGEPALVAL